MAVNVLRHCEYTIMAHPVPDEPLTDEPLFRCRRDFFGKVLGRSEILRIFAVHCPKKPRSSRLPKIDAIGRRKGGRHIGYGIRYA